MPQEYLLDTMFEEIFEDIIYIKVYSSVLLSNNTKKHN